ncbi:ubiquinol oxidase subunit II [Paenibacillus sp. 1011MAR3C5]|uniref:ubiquinol oxidase subunit II n=1 Tax=Paenibacillus sp. 1011MAR3C5 TaxID=1675787 RepID=UPI000E6D294C|nr:ubiquinol oxidase subunit II [Paenibacillus sp. 1011MAR3C5]RJE86017.1 ubiquinol oxidase subunit II [Paenibacillus sp. 1011MAR3C5]
MRRNYRMLTAGLFLAMVFLLSGCSEQYIVLDPKGPIGQSQKDLIIISTVLCAVIIIPVLVMTAVIVWRYRDRPGSKAKYKPNWEHNTKLEVTWWSIPIVIIIILAAVTINYTYKLEPSRAIASEKAPITIQVTSMDWKWLFKYPDEDIATVNYVKFPEDVPVRFQLTSDTAMNSFWIPQLGGQLYSMSGMAMTLYLQADELGSYYGSGANFNGKDFAQMTFKADAVSQEEYDAWIQEVKKDAPALTLDGYKELQKPGRSDVQQFSSFPEGLFEQIVTQYVEEGSSGAHSHHGASSDTSKNEASSKNNDSETETADASDQHNGHAGH